MKPIALVIPWYGDEIIGGAEKECNYLAHSLQEQGEIIEVLTTCVKDATCDRGKNTIEPGVHYESGIKVIRFLVREKRNVDLYSKSNQNIYNNTFNDEDEKNYFEEDINSEDMYEYIRKNNDKYRAFVFIPYMYGITFNGSYECPDNCILIPCLHDESYAYMNILKEKMKSYKGMIFHAKPEYELANKLFDLNNVKTDILGEGIDTDWYEECDAESFRIKYNIYDDFILFAGRKDAGKKADELINFYLRYKDETLNSTLKLVMLGGGELPVDIPAKYKNDVIDLGFISVEDKHNAFFACTIFCNPSYFESFSLVIMESWIAKKPVLVSEHCAVTSNFCLETNGGLWYSDYYEFKECINYMLNNKEICEKMGLNGFEYVMNNFTHKKVAEKYLKFIDELGM